MAIVKKISELTPKGSALGVTDLLVVGVDNGTDYDLKSVTGAQLLGTVVSQTITDSVTTKSPSENAVFDALSLKVDKVAGSRLITSAEGTILGNTSGTNTGDQNLQQVTDKGSKTTQQLISNEGLFVKTAIDQTLSAVKANALKTQGEIQVSDLIGNSTFYRLNEINYGTNSVLLPSSAGTLALTSDLTSKVDGNTAITGATKTKITYDSKGLVTSGADATTADIADSSNKRYVTDANLTTIGNTSGTNTGDQIISDATITTTDITTNNFTTAKHGFVPKGTNVGNYLKDDGTWGAISAGGLTYFTEAQSTASPNATVNVDSLTAVASTTNADFVIKPKGSGAILAAIPDGTTTGGNKRGANAVDLQTNRAGSGAAYVASGLASVLCGGADNRSTNIYSSVLGGNFNSATGQYSSQLGGYSNTISGNFSAGGGSTSNVSGASSFAFGSGNTVAGDYCMAFGINNIANYFYNGAIGQANTSSGTASMTLGANNIASGNYSQAKGNNANTFLVNGRFAWSSAGIGATGDAQSSKLMLIKRTTNAALTVLSSDNLAAATTNQLTLQNNNSIRFKGTIIGRQSGSTNTSAWDIDGIIQRGTSAGTTTLLISNVNVVQNTPAWGTPTLTANTTLGCLTITVTGVATTNIQWTCVIDTTEVIYA